MFNPLNIFSKLIKSGNEKELSRIQQIVNKVNLLEKDLENLSDEMFPKKTDKLIEDIKNGKSLNDVLPEAFSMVREASKRIRNERHFDVQLIGGVVIHENKIAEMKTGEGKTLVSTLAAYLNSLQNNSVHIVTVNDYLAKRDSEWMGVVYEKLGLKTGFIVNGMDEDERKKAYSSDITYGTNNEFGFDYLRDNMKFSKDQLVQSDFSYAIIDEVDSILIDEARTPLIISGATEDKTNQYIAVDKLVKNLKEEDFEIDEKDRNILLTNKGVDNVENIFSNAGILKNKNFYDPENLQIVHLVNQSLRAIHLFQSGRDYIVKDGQIIIIDEQTGRQLPLSLIHI